MTKLTMEEAIGEALRSAEVLAAIQVKGDYITFGTGYEIPAESCSTYRGILAWSLELSQKDWITPAMLHRFAEVACEARGLEYPRV